MTLISCHLRKQNLVFYVSPCLYCKLSQRREIKESFITPTAAFSIKWAETGENIPPDMCAQRRLKSACASAQSDQSYLSVWRNFAALALRKHAYSNIYKISPPKNWKFSDKNSGIFQISAQNIDCGYSLEPPLRGGSNEYPQSMFF